MRDFLCRMEGDPRTQYLIHRLAARFWIINAVAVTLVYFLAPGIWAKASVLYLIMLSLYSNWSTDAGAMSAADSATDEQITAYAAAEEER